MLVENLLSEEEQLYFKRGRNAHSHTKAKNTDHKTYSISTGFESLLGYLHLSKQNERLDELVAWCIEKIGTVDKYEPK
jgi:ribonuclease-3 family protein